MNGKIIVVTHKNYEMPEEDIYLPICVGSGVSTLSEKFQPDNTGPNISEKNMTYCELTAVYWAWKNMDVDNLDYVGIAHYRRHFSLYKRATTLDRVICGQDIEKIYEKHGKNTIITTSKRRYISSVENHYIYSQKRYESIHKNDILHLKEAIQMVSPEYTVAARAVLTGHAAHMLNMFVMCRENFMQYCEWLFSVIDQTVALSTDRMDQRRYAGALSEFCLDIWIKKNQLEVLELNLLETEKVPFFKKVSRYIHRKIVGKC